jgi:hypothetical protein
MSHLRNVTAAEADLAEVKKLVVTYCLDCHDADSEKGDLDLEALLDDDIPSHAAIWESVVLQMSARQMPPIDEERPSDTAYDSAVDALIATLDAAWKKNPRPGNTTVLRRLTRAEYQNAIRDLLALEIDGAKLLPKDEESHGFDNVTVSELSPALLERYISASQKISRLAVGRPLKEPDVHVYRVRPDITQEERIDGLPLGTRGGALIEHPFPRDGEYEVRINLSRDRNEDIEGMNGRHQLDVLVDGDHMKRFELTPPKNKQEHTNFDQHLVTRIPVRAGLRDLGVTFAKTHSALQETQRKPYQSHFNMHRHPRLSPAVFQVSITGPYEDAGPGTSASRARILTGENPEQVLRAIMRRAYRRPVTDQDLVRPLQFFEQGKLEGGFDAGVESALSAILVSREFLFRVERPPKDVVAGEPYALSDVELASRLSFFLWSSIPDETLLALAEKGELHKPAVLLEQTRRMLADDRSKSLVKQFAGQWLYLRNLDSVVPDGRLFPDFDDNLRQAMRTETEFLFEQMIREDRSVLDLLRSDQRYVNERLAKHYRLPNVQGERFRLVDAPGGLLRQGSILTVTSYATRTSPVIRGNWVLENLLGSSSPPAPPDVPALEDVQIDAHAPIRERLAAHRENPACAGCHNIMDPVGFALEEFDAVGRQRFVSADSKPDAWGGLPDGSKFYGVAGLEAAILARPELFVHTLTEKLLTFALGRGVDFDDAPAIREVVRNAAEKDYRFSELIIGLVSSKSFGWRVN